MNISTPPTATATKFNIKTIKAEVSMLYTAPKEKIERSIAIAGSIITN